MNEKIFVEIGGLQQCMILQTEDIKNPILLLLHGGPGSPEIAFTQKHPTGLEKLFTICWWEQRGSGRSYNRRIPPETMTMEQMIADTIEVTHYLQKRFHKEKIYVMGHSWGSLLGVLTVQQAPELFHAYIGTGQVICQDKSERLAYTYMLEQFRAAGNQKMVCKLEKHPIDKGGTISMKYLAVRSDGMIKLGIGIMRQYTAMMDVVKIVLGYKGYTFLEKIKFPLGGSFSMKYLWDDVMKTNFEKQVPKLDVPVYILQGKFDYQVSYALAKQYLQGLEAPIKGFYTFEQSAHSPYFEEPEKAYRILCEDVLNAKTDLADAVEVL